MVADSQNQQCGIIFLAYSLAHKLAVRIGTRPNQVIILLLSSTNVNAHASTRRYSLSRMGLSKKRRLHIEQMTARSLDSRKHRKIDLETQRKKEILRRQREEED